MNTVANSQDAIKQRLQQRLDELVAIQTRSADSRKAVKLDQSSVGRLSRMDAIQGQQMAQETGRRRKIEIQQIQAALKRIETGDYGYCVSCDEPISLKRLENDPAAPFCIECARKRG